MRVLGINVPFKGITLTKTGGQHGYDSVLSDTTIAENFGDSMGFVFKSQDKKLFILLEILFGMIMLKLR